MHKNHKRDLVSFAVVALLCAAVVSLSGCLEKHIKQARDHDYETAAEPEPVSAKARHIKQCAKDCGTVGGVWRLRHDAWLGDICECRHPAASFEDEGLTNTTQSCMENTCPIPQ